ncbi:acyl-CoA dehydrogenase [Oleiphilus messinensis]|uniref:Acyl-CoA dehydrogenase n=2 Tax=Oleiphilus messinensis TaxID=141451 RepID=A0A1Y0I7V5_9GAMM|nr:acyl-CoA dehydrogenase [Oleiphilus messinensis]
MMHYDGHHNRIDRIVRPKETEMLEQEVFGELLFNKQKSPWIKLIKMLLIYENGEACVSCPVTCTEGLVELLDKYADTPELKHILMHCREGIDGDIAIGAQYLSEIQGGSDVQANRLEALEEDGVWRPYGSKFFCSATHADYAVITAKPQGSEDVALFVMPSWLPGNKEKEIRNSYTIDRIKWKMGTSELTSGELTFNGAVAYPVGPLDKGISNVVGIVLTYSRLTVGLSAAAFMLRAAREATQYTEFREVFGQKVNQFPMAKRQIDEINYFAQRTTAGAFKLYRDFLKTDGATSEEKSKLEFKKKQFKIRELIMLQKLVGSMDSTDVLRKAMSMFGGYGIMEDFSSLPRLYRDSAINELWEGPRNVLMSQLFRDMQSAKAWYPPTEFVADVLEGATQTLIETFAKELSEIINHPSLFVMDDATLDICARIDRFCTEFFHTYQDLALSEVN